MPAEMGAVLEMNGVLERRYKCASMRMQANPELAKTWIEDLGSFAASAADGGLGQVFFCLVADLDVVSMSSILYRGFAISQKAVTSTHLGHESTQKHEYSQ